jgi:hypothetical protein
MTIINMSSKTLNLIWVRGILGTFLASATTSEDQIELVLGLGFSTFEFSKFTYI